MNIIKTPTRPVLRWHGGKWILAKWIISLFPKHKVYVEPFCGAASVLMQKPRSYAEIINDLDGEVVNLFRVLRDPTTGRRLEMLLRLTPFARHEFNLSYVPDLDPVEQARRTIVRSFMGFGSNSHNRATGFRANSNRSGTTPAHDWGNYPDNLIYLIERLQGVTIENRDAMEISKQHDSYETLHYWDPPYEHTTRAKGMQENYRFEMDEAAHIKMAEVAKTLKGMVIISGYSSDLYTNLFSDWVCLKKKAHADGARVRTECIWLNDACIANTRNLFNAA